ncbi:hypothetical protein BJ912DRAFT_1143208 [Pholiota molesta]|nr:hypothetical protein BJ912DRAFT_1143208 [Pholiota molesta]
MKNVFITCLLAFPLLLASAAPLDVPKLDRRSGVHVVARPTTPRHSCTCHGRVHHDVYHSAHDPNEYHNLEALHLPNCPSQWQGGSSTM